MAVTDADPVCTCRKTTRGCYFHDAFARFKADLAASARAAEALYPTDPERVRVLVEAYCAGSLGLMPDWKGR